MSDKDHFREKRLNDKAHNITLGYYSPWQTKTRGGNDAEYQIYVECATDLGWPIKTYDEWVSS